MLMYLIHYLYSHYDAPNMFNGWQNMSSPIGEELVYFHDIFMWLAISTCILIISLLIIVNKINLFPIRNFNHNYFLEILWTISPAIILLILSYPSFKLLYMMDDTSEPSMIVKAIGHQWYWSYEINNNIEFDSYMIPLEELNQGFRLLEVDNKLSLPWGTSIRLITSSTDVIHSWCIPSLGIKLDSIPGRLNSIIFHIDRIGLFYGQCSELCGTNHAFMPIVIESLFIPNYWESIKSL